MSRRKPKSDDKSKYSDDERESKVRNRRGGSRRTSSSSGARKSNDRHTRDTNDMGSKDRPKTVSLSSANDAAWYTKSPEQVNNVANVSFMDALGTPLEVYPSGQGYAGTNRYAAPGVMRIGYVPTFGCPKDPGDAMNVAMNKTYAEIRYANSGSRNYDAPDYMKYLAVMDSAYAFGGYLKRILGFINSYSSVNRYWPRQFYEAMRVDYDDVKDNIAALRTYINNYVSKVNSLAVPNNLPIFERHYWMSLNVYMDGNTPWAQTYLMVPEVYAKYNYATGSVNFYNLVPKSGKMTFADLTDIGDEIINNIMSSQDFYIMSGDTIKAFGGQLFQIAGVEADFTQYPVYDPGVLNQLMNSNALGTPLAFDSTSSDWNEPTAIKQFMYGLYEDTTTGALVLGVDDGGVTYGVYFGNPQTTQSTAIIASLNARKYMVNLTVDDITPVHVIESTRATAIPEYQSTSWKNSNGVTINGIMCEVFESGADVFTTFEIYTGYMYGTVVQFDHTEEFSSILILDQQDQLMYQHIEFLSLLDSFDWHPIIYSGILKGNSSYLAKDTLFPPFLDIYRCAVVDKHVLSRIHDVANLSLFDITITNSFRH